MCKGHSKSVWSSFCHDKLGMIEERRGDLSTAEAHFTEALEIVAPDPELF